MWIKICGNTNLADALFSAECGANALGFVFAESPRQVTVEQVRDITGHLPDHVETYGVFVDANFETIVNAVLECGLTGIQLHTASDPSLLTRLRSYFEASLGAGPLKIMQAVHYSPNLDADLDALLSRGEVDALLIDSRAAKAPGGTGVAFDWQAARAAFLRHSSQANLIAAGGLTPNNVADAIATLEPWGVDVVTGVESAPGKKDAVKVRTFVENARAAESRESANR